MSNEIEAAIVAYPERSRHPAGLEVETALVRHSHKWLKGHGRHTSFGKQNIFALCGEERSDDFPSEDAEVKCPLCADLDPEGYIGDFWR